MSNSRFYLISFTIFIMVVCLSYWKFPPKRDHCIELIRDNDVAILKEDIKFECYERKECGRFFSKDGKSFIEYDKDKGILKLTKGSSIKYFKKVNPRLFEMNEIVSK